MGLSIHFTYDPDGLTDQEVWAKFIAAATQLEIRVVDSQLAVYVDNDVVHFQPGPNGPSVEWLTIYRSVRAYQEDQGRHPFRPGMIMGHSKTYGNRSMTVAYLAALMLLRHFIGGVTISDDKFVDRGDLSFDIELDTLLRPILELPTKPVAGDIVRIDDPLGPGPLLLIKDSQDPTRVVAAPPDGGRVIRPSGTMTFVRHWLHQVTQYEETKVEIDDDYGPYDAFVDRAQRWNGWLMPWFTREVAEQILKEVGRPYTVDAEGVITTTYDDGSEGEENVAVFEPTELWTVTDEKVYGLFSGSWIWSAYEPPVEDDDGD